MTSASDTWIPYKPKIWVMVLVVLFFGACLAVFLSQLLGDDLGASRRLRGFAPETQRMIYWVLAAFAAAFTLLGVVGIFKGLTSKAEILITDDAISAPKSGISSKIETVRFADLEGMDVTNVGKQKFLALRHAGRTLNIAAQSLPKGTSVEDLFHEVDARRSKLFGQG